MVMFLVTIILSDRSVCLTATCLDHSNKYLLIAMDYFSKWPEAYPLPNQEAITVAKVLVNEFFCRFGITLELHSDQGRNFESNVFQEVYRLLHIKKTRTTPLHPQSDGMVERLNRTIEAQLAIFVRENQTDWDFHIPFLLMAYRSAVHDTTKCTPAELMFGRNLRLPIDLLYGRPEDEYIADTEYVILATKQPNQSSSSPCKTEYQSCHRLHETLL